MRVSFEVAEAAHVAVFRVDGNGRLMVLWPERNGLQTAARAGREYQVHGPRSSYAAFAADYEVGQGMVIAIASSDPIDLSSFRRHRNDQTYYRYASMQRPYTGGVKYVVDRITQEILYASDSPYDYDIAFYSVAGRSFYASSYCDNHFTYFGGVRYPRTYSDWGTAYGYSNFDECYRGSLYGGYLAYCSGWYAFSGLVDSRWCRFGNPFWPSTPSGPIAGGPQPQPRPNTDMIDTIMSRPVDKYPVIDRNTGEQASSGTTHVITMEPVRDAPNGTRWLPDDDSDAISIPSRFRRDPGDPARQGGRINTREEGFTRSPGSGIRVADPSAGSGQPERSPGRAFMPPVREAPRPEVWRDADRNGGSYTAPQRWQRPTTSEPRTTPRNSDSDRIDRGHTSTGTSSPSTGGATVTPRTDASVTKTEGSKAPDAKASGERKPK